MAKEVVIEIKNNYGFYSSLCNEQKLADGSLIQIIKPGNNKNILEVPITVWHSRFPNSIKLLVAVKKHNYKFFQLKLRCKDLCRQPFFRYDSDGDTHRNYGEDIRLEDQQVTTPHFHYYNEQGVNIAYKTSALLKEETRKALEDIDICINHFFDEAKIISTSGNINVEIQPGLLSFPVSEVDPNHNVNFK